MLGKTVIVINCPFLGNKVGEITSGCPSPAFAPGLIGHLHTATATVPTTCATTGGVDVCQQQQVAMVAGTIGVFVRAECVLCWKFQRGRHRGCRWYASQTTCRSKASS